MRPANVSIKRFEQGYVRGLLALHHKTLSEMKQHGLLLNSHGHSAALLADAKPHCPGLAWLKRQANPRGHPRRRPTQRQA